MRGWLVHPTKYGREIQTPPRWLALKGIVYRNGQLTPTYHADAVRVLDPVDFVEQLAKCPPLYPGRPEVFRAAPGSDRVDLVDQHHARPAPPSRRKKCPNPLFCFTEVQRKELGDVDGKRRHRRFGDNSPSQRSLAATRRAVE